MLVLALLVASPSSALAQRKPFPQGGGYGRGYLPRHLTAADVRSSYASWK